MIIENILKFEGILDRIFWDKIEYIIRDTKWEKIKKVISLLGYEDIEEIFWKKIDERKFMETLKVVFKYIDKNNKDDTW